MADGDVLEFAQRVLALVDGSRRVSTYKLAVLLGLIDCAALGLVDPDGVVRLEDLAARVIEQYWLQVRPAPMTGERLRQSEQPRALAVDYVAGLRAAAAGVGARTPGQAELLLPDAYRRCVADVAWVLASQPLAKLQRPQGWRSSDAYPIVLYEDGIFPEKSASRRAVASGALDIRLLPGVAEKLISLAGLLRPLLELTWTRQVAALNQLDREEDDLQRFLFGTERGALAPVRDGLVEVQHGKCFYCGKSLRTAGDVHVDHFIPWSRVPEDGLANLVVADPGCNLDKSDLLAASRHIERWVARDSVELDQLAGTVRWPVRPWQTRLAAIATYGALPDGIQLWVAAKEREPHNRDVALGLLR